MCTRKTEQLLSMSMLMLVMAMAFGGYAVLGRFGPVFRPGSGGSQVPQPAKTFAQTYSETTNYRKHTL